MAAEMFVVGDFWLEIRVIIKFCSILEIQEPLTNIHRFLFLKKGLKWPTQKNNRVFQNGQFSEFFVKILEIGPWISRID